MQLSNQDAVLQIAVKNESIFPAQQTIHVVMKGVFTANNSHDVERQF
jgi:hypothetical protein